MGKSEKLSDLSSLEQVLDAVHVEGEREAQRLVERIALGGGYYITGIELEHTHLETGTDGKVLAVALVLGFVMIACTERELVIIGVLCSYAIVNLLQLFLEAAWRIAEALEDASNG